MKSTAHTNLLVRAIMADDAQQSRLAQGALERAVLVAAIILAFCEFVRVLTRG